jgi:hypothetical protein
MNQSDQARAGADQWWWSQIPKPLRLLFAIVSFLAAILPLIVVVVNYGASLAPQFLIMKNWVWRGALPAQKSELPPPPGQQPPVRPIVSGVFDGYVYYEVGTDGKPTGDGQLKPAGGGPMPAFWDIHVGYRLKAATAVNIRLNPNPYNGWDNSGFNTVVRILGGGECVQVIEGEVRRYPVQVAASGGFLPVVRATCS